MIAAAEIGRFREVLARRLGWHFTDHDAGQLGMLLAERAAGHGLEPADYLNRLAGWPWADEMTVLVERLSITETYFFRHGEQFRALRTEALPERVAARAGQRVLRMLSVGCSSGEEAYTLAIIGRRVQPDPDWIISVLGVDANRAMLERAETGWYPAWSLRETPEAVRCRWFRPADGGYRVADDARKLVQFRHGNVAEPDDALWQPEQYDVIFCRNLLMYLTPAVASSLIARMTGALVTGGFLFLGHTDTLGPGPAGLEPRHTHEAFYYRRTAGTPPAQRPAPPAAPLAARAHHGQEPRPEELRTPELRTVELRAAELRTEESRPEEERPEERRPEETRNRALALLREERFAEALTLVESAPAATGRLLRGVLLCQAGRLDEAAVVARRLIEADGLDPDAHQLLGLCLEGAAETGEAIGQYTLAAYLDPAFALPRLRLGQLALRRGDHRVAAGELEYALDLLPGEDEERIILFGGGFGRFALTVVCRTELDACGARR